MPRRRKPSTVRTPERAAPARTDRWLASILTGCGMAAALILAIALGTYLPVKEDTTTPESAHLQIAWMIRNHQPVYTDWQTHPPYLAVYGPLYYRLVGLAGRAAQVDRNGLVWVGRVISASSFLLAAALLWLLVRRLTGTMWSAWIALLPLAWLPPTAVRFLASTRPDAPALALSIAGLLLGATSKRAPLLAAAVCFSLALQIKAAAVAAPLALILALLFDRQFRRAVLFASVMLAANTTVWVVGHFATDGHLWQHVLAVRFAPRDLGYLTTMVTDNWVIKALIVMTLVGLLAATLLARKKCFDAMPRLPLRVAWLYGPAAFAIAAVLATRQGGDINYVIEPAAALGLLIGAVASAVPRLDDARLRQVMRLCGVLLLVCTIATLPPLLILDARYMAYGAKQRCGVRAEAIAWSRLQQQPVLSLDPWLSYQSGIGGFLSDPVVYASIVTARPDLDVVARRVAERHFQTIILRGPLEEAHRIVYQDMPYAWPRLRTAIAENYVERESRNGWYAYGRLN